MSHIDGNPKCEGKVRLKQIHTDLFSLKLLLSLGLFLVLILGRGPLAFGQTDQGSITGVVTDAGGGAIPNADVALVSTDTGLALSAKSDANGSYTFAPLKIGRYKLTVKSEGFGTVTQTNLEVHAQQRLQSDVTLQVGSVVESVEVSTGAQLMQTEDAAVGQQLTTQAINDTPLNGRNFVYIAQLATGVAPVSGSRGGGSGDFSSNGQRATMNNFLMDGVDNNASLVDFVAGSSYIVRPPPDALAEFKVQTANYSAEFGHSAGAVVNASLKSGTNNVHGSVWEYIRNTHLNSRDWNFDRVPPYHQNQFGATLGLPLIPNKLFFFGDVEANRIVTLSSANTITVPTAKMRTGDFSDLLNTSYTRQAAPIQLRNPNTGNIIAGNRLDLDPSLTLNPIALKILSLYPCPTANASQAPTQNCRVDRKFVDNTWQFDTRVDWNASAKDQAFGRFSYSNERISKASPLGPILDGGAFNDAGTAGFLGENLALSETHIFNNSLTNEVRFGYNYGNFFLAQSNSNTNLSSTFGLGGIPFQPGYGGLPAATNLNLFGSNTINNWGSPQYYGTFENQNVGQFLDNLTKVKGNHTFKVGINLLYIRFATKQPTTPRGTYNFNGQFTGNQTGGIGSGVADFLLNKINTAALTTVAQSDQIRWDNGAFFQDDWKIRRNLTLNIGIRWEDPTSYRDLRGRQANFIPTGPLGVGTGTANLLIPIVDGTNPVPPNFANLATAPGASSVVTAVYTNNQYLVNNQWKNLGPRLGLAYQPNNRTVIRAGFGIFHSGVESTGYGPNIGSNYPFLPTSNFISTGCSVPTGGTVSSCDPARSNLGNPITLESGFSDVLSTGIASAVTSPIMNGIDPRTKVPYTNNYNLGVQYQLSNTMSIWGGYVGSQNHKMLINPNQNGGYAVARTGTNIATLRAFPKFGDLLYQTYRGQSSYNSLQASLQKQSKNLTFVANYTWSHSISIGQSLIGGGGTPTVDSRLVDIKSSAADSSFDTRHRFTLNGNWTLPFGNGQKFLNTNGFANALIGGWATSLTFTMQTGNPFAVTTTNGNGFNPAAGSPTNVYAIPVGDPFKGGGTPSASNPSASCPAQVRTRDNWYNPCAFNNPVSGNTIPTGTRITGSAALAYLGNSRPNQIHGPGNYRANMSLFKNFKAMERYTLQLRADAFNITNHPSWANPTSVGIDANGGRITRPVPAQKLTPDARFFQFSAKLLF